MNSDSVISPEAIANSRCLIDPRPPTRIALDIDEIREESLTNLEAALVTTTERDRGMILLNRQSSSQRRRFSLAHEMLHFLNHTHEQTSENGFRCTKSDMRVTGQTRDRHQRQEVEANTFAIELLAP